MPGNLSLRLRTWSGLALFETEILQDPFDHEVLVHKLTQVYGWHRLPNLLNGRNW